MFTVQYVRAQGTSKAVIIITSPDAAFYEKTLHTIIEKNPFESCVIICAVHSSILNYMGVGSYDKLKDNIFGWMKEKSPEKEVAVEILYRPIFIAPITDNLFVTPPMEHLMPRLDGKITDEHETSINYLVSSLHSLFTHFNVNEDIYALGDFSNYVAKKLEDFPPAVDRRKAGKTQSGVTLILIDRTLDLSTATKNDTDCVLSRILSTLPHLPYHNNDVAVNMTPLCPDLKESPVSMTVPGCLASTDHETTESFIAEREKEILRTFHRWLLDISTIGFRNPKTILPTRLSVHTLDKLYHKILDNENPYSIMEYYKKLKRIQAFIQSIKLDKSTQLELLVSLEKMILQNLAVSRRCSDGSSQLCNIIKNRNEMQLDMENLLVLLIHIYAMAGTEINFSSESEAELKSELTNAIFEDIMKCDYQHYDYDDDDDDGDNDDDDGAPAEEPSVYQQTLHRLGATDEVTAKSCAEKLAERIIDALHSIAIQRKHFRNYGSMIFNPRSNQELDRHKSLLRRVLNEVFPPSWPHPFYFKQNTIRPPTGCSSICASLFCSRPMNNPWMVIFIIGGIAVYEAKLFEAISRTQNHPRVKLAGGRIFTPVDTADRVFFPILNKPWK